MDAERRVLAVLLLSIQLCCHGGVFAEEVTEGPPSTDYCVLGAGPGGLQIGYFLERAGRQYVIFERNSTAGSFFQHYPRHRTLVSINKRNTGSSNTEFSFRHDWNSLISDDDSLQMKHYTRKYFPAAQTYERYLQDYARKLKLNIKYNTEIVDVSQLPEGNKLFQLTDQDGMIHQCKIVILSTGVWVPAIPTTLEGIEHTVGYEDMSIDPEDYENKFVLIIGRGNSGFETADAIVSNTALIHMAGRSRIKFAFQTHYVGDLRTVNAEQVDTYQLKSLDGQFEGTMSDKTARIVKTNDGKLHLVGLDDDDQGGALHNTAYDVIIRCLGFQFDFSIFNSSVPLRQSPLAKDKYPYIHGNYQAVGVPNLFVAGTASHSLDYRKSAGGFIHGFRYTARALFRHMEWLYQKIPWPSVTLPSSQLLEHLIRRINEASGPYQMFGVLGDVVLIRDDGNVVYLEEVPIKAIPLLRGVTGHKADKFIMWNFEYGKNFSGPGKDVLREDRVGGDVISADKSNFLHPVLYYYAKPLPLRAVFTPGESPEPDLYHHLVEDFLTDWTKRTDHIIPLRRFLEAVFNEDLRSFFADSCFEMMLSYVGNVPAYCRQQYLQGAGISLSDGFVKFGVAETFDESVNQHFLA